MVLTMQICKGLFSCTSSAVATAATDTGADFTKELKSRFRLKSKTLVLDFVKRMLSLWS